MLLTFPKREREAAEKPSTKLLTLRDIFLKFFIFCILFSVNFFIATFKNSKVTDGTKFKNALGESLRDMRSVLLSSKL